MPKPIQIQTLDGRMLSVLPDEVVTPQSCILIAKGEGMPVDPSGDVIQDNRNLLKSQEAKPKGDLYLKFDIQFPKKLLNEHRESILAALRENDEMCA